MANILIGYNNRALDATMTSNGSWDGTLVLNNIKSERLALVARTSSASRNNTTFVAKFAANYALRAIALLNHNVSTAGRWRARVSAATLDLDYTGTNPRNPGTVTYGGGANGTYVDYLGTVTSGSCPRFDYSPVNLASGAATQTVSSVPAGRYVLSCSGSGSVTATGSTVDNSGTVGTQSVVTFVDVSSAGDVTLTVAGTVTAINFRESLGLLVEEARTNLLLRSSALLTSPWSPGNLSYSGATIAAPDGSSVEPITTTGGGSTINFQQMTAPAVPFTISAYVRDLNAGSNSMVNKYGVYNGSTSSDVAYLAVDYATGAVAASGPEAGSSVVRSTPCHNGWHRVSITISAGVTPGDIINIYAGALGDIPSAGVSWYAWGLQMEAGAFPASYIPTTSAAVTRTADNPRASGSNFTGFYNATAGTLFVEATSTATAATRGLASLNDNSHSNVTQLFLTSSDAPQLEVYNGATQANLTASAVTPTTAFKVAGAYKANDFALCSNGGAVGTDTSGAVPTVTQLSIGAINGGTHQLNGHIRRITYWPTRLANAELQAITTTGPEAIGYDSGWQDALAMTFHGDTPANWGAQYPLIAATSEAVTARYLTVEIDDTTNAAGYVQIGHLYASGGFQPEHNAEHPGFADGRIDPSDVETSVTGRVYGTKREQRRKVDFSLPVLSQDEADHVDELRAAMGITESVLYVPDPANAAHSQRYSFWGRFAEVNQLEYPFYENRSTIFRLEQKK